jgi:hypothetical protein
MRTIFAIVFVAICTMMFVLGSLYWRYDSSVKKIEKRGIASIAGLEVQYTRHEEQFWRDQDSISQYEFLSIRTCARDAGSYINARILWDGEDAQVSRWRKRTVGDVPLFDDLNDFHSHIRKLEDWTTAHTHLDLEPYDTSWLGDVLERFDCWDSDAFSPLPSRYPYEPMTSPIPNYALVQHWVRIRLLQGLQGKEPEKALETARGWAKLLFTTESLVGSMVAISILKMESKTGISLRAQGVPLTGWAPIPKVDLDAMARVFMSVPAFTSLWTPSDKLNGDKLKVGRCIALAEATTMGWMLKEPLSALRGAQVAHIDEQLAATKDECRLTMLRKLWKSAPTDALSDPTDLCSAMPEHEVCSLFPQMPLGPIAQQALGLELAAISAEAFLFNRYR